MTIRVAAIEVNRSLPDLPADPYIALADQRWIHRFWGFASSHRGADRRSAPKSFLVAFARVRILLPLVTSAPYCGQHTERSDL
jgi:hypothetical protein